MAKDKQTLDDALNIKPEAFKTVKFGGYDKNSVDFYIEDLKSEHAKEVDDLKGHVNKLSEAVLSLKTMREVNMTESTKTIDGLKETNEALEKEIEDLKAQLNVFKQREFESAGRYESISRTLLEARESADLLAKQTEDKCAKMEEDTQAKCDALEQEVVDRCNKLQAETEIQCQEMTDQTETYCKNLKDQTELNCKNMKEQAYSDSERARNTAREEAQALEAKTKYECQNMREEAIMDAENTRNTATDDANRLRNIVKRECESVENYMGEFLAALDKVVSATKNAKDIADKEFTNLESTAVEAAEEE